MTFVWHGPQIIAVVGYVAVWAFVTGVAIGSEPEDGAGLGLLLLGGIVGIMLFGILYSGGFFAGASP